MIIKSWPPGEWEYCRRIFGGKSSFDISPLALSSREIVPLLWFGKENHSGVVGPGVKTYFTGGANWFMSQVVIRKLFSLVGLRLHSERNLWQL
ncbi:MAG: hypothetical protein IPO98_08130 [Saprospiraceae bacterium]|nr:hypothetical protein [Saprospiraceae bacterium]